MPTYRVVPKTTSSLGIITKTLTRSLKTYLTWTKMATCKIGHQTDAKKSSITSMHRQQALSRMLKTKSLCLTTKNSSTTLKKRSFPPTLLASATYTVNFNKSIRKSIILHCNMCTPPLSHTRKTSSKSITLRLITSKSVIKSCKGSRTWKVH